MSGQRGKGKSELSILRLESGCEGGAGEVQGLGRVRTIPLSASADLCHLPFPSYLLARLNLKG